MDGGRMERRRTSVTNGAIRSSRVMLNLISRGGSRLKATSFRTRLMLLFAWIVVMTLGYLALVLRLSQPARSWTHPDAPRHGDYLQRYSSACAYHRVEFDESLNTSIPWPPIWPHPWRYGNGTATVPIAGSIFRFISVSPSEELEAAFTRFQPLMFGHRSEDTDGISDLFVNVAVLTADLRLGTGESYKLVVPHDGSPILIEAVTVYGAYHALETLSQLVRFNFDTRSYEVRWAPWCIDDRPRFPHREVLVDSSRHFLPVPTLKRFISSLPYAKINTLHWHLVDRQAFPFDSPRRPLLSRLGAWSPEERYTMDDLAEVVQYAKLRGVRVMVELDVPGHAAIWCKAHPEICPAPDCLMPLNPSVDVTYEVVRDLLLDLTGGVRGGGPFPLNMLHLGGDEVNPACWNSTPEIYNWMQRHKYNTERAFEHFVNRTLPIVREMGRIPVVWEDIWYLMRKRLPKDVIVQSWNSGRLSGPVDETFHRVLWNKLGAWYLDQRRTRWSVMYQQELCKGLSDDGCANRVLGGGGCMWGEHTDSSTIEPYVWPRLAAIAERLWSPREINSTAAAKPRLAAWRCHADRRGVAVTPMGAGEAGGQPGTPRSCYNE
eukprot:TRINITY_DN10267_c0_g1_i1.p1 TRINITY_DN10267_c0_g1~~TRINITY_DN10267_c0_g1_i1.p1  ORF type:complete len:603 (+),score=139.14 TRINITY_DN10267_c0_g1_i1:123-1931(+)